MAEHVELEEANAFAKGSRPALIQSFGIEGLYGYRSISLSSEYAATILIARNGTGKTTLLGALDAFLRMQLSRLRNLEFSVIKCRIRGHDEELCLTHEDVIEFLQVPTDGEIIRLAGRSNVEPSTLFSFLLDEWPEVSADYASYSDNKVASALMAACNYSTPELRNACGKALEHIMSRHDRASRLFSTITELTKGYDIVYLPTYRRVELALSGTARGYRQTRRRKPKFDLAAGSLFTGDIQFGLADISDRLAEINERIVFDSNNGYRKISANIINELIDGSFDNEPVSDLDVPTIDELRLFFDRIEHGRRTGPFMPVTTPNLEKAFTGEGVSASSGRFLNYFLGKLSTVIRSTKDIELPVDEFIRSCNKYLRSIEPSTQLDSQLPTHGHEPVDGKQLRLNRTNLRVSVESIPERRRISLDALSSGEKQMISLFAKLFLYPDRKIVLIDEPELSLSIDWQKEILVDVINSSLCEQVIAITHSPFVFDNKLEPFARSLRVGRNPNVSVTADESEAYD